MAVITDLVHKISDIHPANKKDVGIRLALWALAKDYGRKDIVPGGPIYGGGDTMGNKYVISFSNVGGGLKTRLGGKAGPPYARGDPSAWPNRA